MKVNAAPERRFWTVVYAAIALNLAITLPLAAILNTWVDESSTLRTTSGSLFHTVYQAIHYELQPPLYFAILNIWRHLDPSIFFARLFSVLCAALTIYVIAQLMRRFSTRIHPLWIVAIAIHPVLIWAAEEIRVYAFSGLISALLLWTFYDGYLGLPASRRARAAHAALAVVAIYTQYFLGFYVAAALCALVLTKRPTALRQYLGAVVAIAIACLPIALMLRSQISTGTALYMSVSGPVYLLRALYATLFYYVIPIQWTHVGVAVLLLLGVAFAAGLIALHQRRSITTEEQVLWLFTAIISALLLAALYVTKEPFGVRYVFLIFVPVMLAVFCSIMSARKFSLQLLTGWTALLLVCSTLLMVQTYAPLAKKGDWRRVAAFLVATEKPNEPILAFQSESALTLQDYYRGRNQVIAIPHPIDFDNVASDAVILQDQREIYTALQQAPGRHALIWAVTSDECGYENVDYHCPMFEDYLAKNYVVIQDRKFYGSRVRLLRQTAVK